VRTRAVENFDVLFVEEQAERGESVTLDLGLRMEPDDAPTLQPAIGGG
jgi:hypothetical protein